MDSDGNLIAGVPTVFCAFNNQLISAAIMKTANLYGLDLDYYLDNGDPIVRIRSFPT